MSTNRPKEMVKVMYRTPPVILFHREHPLPVFQFPGLPSRVVSFSSTIYLILPFSVTSSSRRLMGCGRGTDGGSVICSSSFVYRAIFRLLFSSFFGGGGAGVSCSFG